MNEEELAKRMQLASTPEAWMNLYKEVFDEEPQLSDENWGVFPIEKIIDALASGKPIKEKPMPDTRVA